MDIFVENLKDLIVDSGKSLRQLAKESGVSATQYSRYLSGSVPTIEITVKIANYFGCSLDYLFGLSELKINNNHKPYKFEISTFLDRYNDMLNKYSISNYHFLKESEFDESIIRHWQKGSVPRLDIVYYIAENLNCSMDWLVGF